MALATYNSRVGGPKRALLWLAAGLGLLTWPDRALADVDAAAAREFAAYVKKSFQEAQARYQTAPAQTNVAWQFARACFDLADLATNATERASLAEQGIAACQQALARESNSAPVHYYLGMNLGQLAQTRGLSALKLVNQMEHAFSRAHDLDERIDWAGPDRNLGLLYRDAPAIVSVGSRSNARKHLERAVKLTPQYPGNRLNLIDAYLKWGELQSARRELKATEAIWPSAQTNLTGVEWIGSWAAWEPRLSQLKKKIEASTKMLGAPHEKN
jgi:tetratricopeptide (TPR) repeat protein